jgi:hypothetical protein
MHKVSMLFVTMSFTGRGRVPLTPLSGIARAGDVIIIITISRLFLIAEKVTRPLRPVPG